MTEPDGPFDGSNKRNVPYRCCHWHELDDWSQRFGLQTLRYRSRSRIRYAVHEKFTSGRRGPGYLSGAGRRPAATLPGDAVVAQLHVTPNDAYDLTRGLGAAWLIDNDEFN